MKTFTMSAMLAAALLTSAPAFAQTTGARKWVVSPFFGSTSGGDATQSAVTVGVSGGWRGNGWVGVELFRPRLAEAGGIFAVEARKLGWDAGGGAEFFQGHVGVRGDLRYFRGLRTSDADVNAFDLDFSNLGFWRATVGMAVRF